MNIKKEFPIFKRKINGKKLIYLDNASTTQRHYSVIYAIEEFYKNYNANIHRGIYALSEKATEMYESSRIKISDFINANQSEIIFTKGATESLNIVASSLSELLKEGDIVLLSEMEHHSNLIPWQIAAKKKKLILKFIPVDENGNLKIDEELFNNVKVVSIIHSSNALGTINDIKKIGDLAHRNNAYFIVDASQSISHMKIDVKDINCDFLAFSGHKIFGPYGVGVLYGKEDILNKIEPFIYGGGMIKEVSLHSSEWDDIPLKFEGGTQNISGAIGLGKAIDYVNKIGIGKIEEHDKELTYYLVKKLSKIKNIKIYTPNEIIGVVSFNINNIHPHDIAELLDKDGICVRAGHHCCMPLMKKLNVNGTVRISLRIYNDKKDIDKLIKSLNKICKRFK